MQTPSNSERDEEGKFSISFWEALVLSSLPIISGMADTKGGSNPRSSGMNWVSGSGRNWEGTLGRVRVESDSEIFVTLAFQGDPVMRDRAANKSNSGKTTTVTA